jgi:hypothetical protein
MASFGTDPVHAIQNATKLAVTFGKQLGKNVSHLAKEIRKNVTHEFKDLRKNVSHAIKKMNKTAGKMAQTLGLANSTPPPPNTTSQNNTSLNQSSSGNRPVVIGVTLVAVGICCCVIALAFCCTSCGGKTRSRSPPGYHEAGMCDACGSDDDEYDEILYPGAYPQPMPGAGMAFPPVYRQTMPGRF